MSRVAIVGQCLGYAAFFHHDEVGAVGQASGLVRGSGVTYEGSMKLGIGLRDKFNPRALYEPLSQSE